MPIQFSSILVPSSTDCRCCCCYYYYLFSRRIFPNEAPLRKIPAPLTANRKIIATLPIRQRRWIYARINSASVHRVCRWINICPCKEPVPAIPIFASWPNAYYPCTRINLYVTINNYNNSPPPIFSPRTINQQKLFLPLNFLPNSRFQVAVENRKVEIRGNYRGKENIRFRSMRELRGIFLEEGLNLQTAVTFRFLQTASRASLRGFLPQIAVSAEERQHEAEGARKVPQYLVSRWKLFFFFFLRLASRFFSLPSFSLFILSHLRTAIRSPLFAASSRDLIRDIEGDRWRNDKLVDRFCRHPTTTMFTRASQARIKRKTYFFLCIIPLCSSSFSLSLSKWQVISLCNHFNWSSFNYISWNIYFIVNIN